MAAQAPSPGFSARILGLCTRLFIWYTIITLAFRCPNDLAGLSDSSSFVCKPAIQVRELAQPYLQPYYDQYAGPYVQKTQPYIDSFNARIYNPVSNAGIGAYQRYGAPPVARARTYSEKEWARVVKPTIDEWTSKASDQYQATIGPRVNRAYSATSPYVEQTRIIAADKYASLLVPAYQKSLPYVQNAYHRSHHYVTLYGIPYTRSALEMSAMFVTRKIWPPIRVLYGQNVEPQLSKIKERLASYRDGKKLEAVADAIDVSSVADDVSISTAYSSTTFTSAGTVTSSMTESLTTIEPSKVPEPVDVLEELKRWQDKFARASDRGAEDLSRRVSDIAKGHISGQVDGVGAAYVTELEEATRSSHESLQSDIISAVSDLSEAASDQEQNKAYERIRATIRSHGQSIKDKAQQLRQWKLQSNDELTILLDEASDSTLSVLDGIRDLGLQEIGMRWAASDHITYEDWTQYHKLKQSFHDWRATVAEVATSHKDVAQARQAAEDIEDKGMGIAQEAAEELARLKDVAAWKIHAQDTSDDFSSRKLPAAAARLGQKIMSKASSAGEAITSTTSEQNMAESIISAATSSAASAASAVSESLSDARQSASSAAADASDSASSVASHASDSASSLASPSSSLTDTILSSSSSLLSAMSSAASSLSNTDDSYASSLSIAADAAASTAKSITSVVGESSGSFSSAATIAAGSVASKASKAARDAANAVEEAVEPEPSGVTGTLSSASKAASKSAPSLNEDMVDGAWSVSESIRSQVSEAGSAYETVTATLKEKASAIAE